MIIGLSTYSMVNKIKDGSMTVLEVMDFANEAGARHIELVPFGFTLYDETRNCFNDELIYEIQKKSCEINLPVSNYAVLGDLLKPNPEDRSLEIERLKRHIDVAAKLGLSTMRHDVSSFRRPLETNTPANFEREFSMMTEGVRELAEYAAEFGITTLIENHGFFVNGSDRVIRLVEAVGCENCKILIDTGNFACVDEDCTVAVKKCLPYTKYIHLKDFYIRLSDRIAGAGGLFRCDSGCWFSSNSGRYMLRGSILGQGDLDVYAIIKDITESGYGGYVSVEFEGMEDCRIGSQVGLSAADTIFKYYKQN